MVLEGCIYLNFNSSVNNNWMVLKLGLWYFTGGHVCRGNLIKDGPNDSKNKVKPT